MKDDPTHSQLQPWKEHPAPTQPNNQTKTPAGNSCWGLSFYENFPPERMGGGVRGYPSPSRLTPCHLPLKGEASDESVRFPHHTSKSAWHFNLAPPLGGDVSRRLTERAPTALRHPLRQKNFERFDIFKENSIVFRQVRGNQIPKYLKFPEFVLDSDRNE